MNKKEILVQLRQAKSAHIQWRSYAQALMAGVSTEQQQVPVVHTECKFGHWYYGDGQALSGLSGYSAIDEPHDLLHQIYMKIYKLAYGEDDRSALQKMLKSGAKAKQERMAVAEDLMGNLLAVSKTLLDAISLLEEEVKDMSEEEVAALY